MVRARIALSLVFAGVQASCAASRPLGAAAGSHNATPRVATQAQPRQADSAPQSRHRKPRLPRDIVYRARLPFYGIRANGETVSSDELLSDLAAARVICVGEEHANAHHHYAELAIVQGLLDRSEALGTEIGLGFEMFCMKDQSVLDAYGQGEIEERQLLENTRFERRWGYDFALYRPLLETGRRHSLALLALNAPSELTRKIAAKGLAALTDEEAKALPELDLDDSEHRRTFDRSMADHPPTAGEAEALYAAQVTWDETMAEVAAHWVDERRPARQLVIAAGMAHCHRAAIPARMLRRGSRGVVSVRPIVRQEQAQAADPQEGYDFALVMTAPEAGEEGPDSNRVSE